MTERAYNSIINICTAVAVISAVLFDAVPLFKWAFLSFGLVAGVTSTITHFYDQWNTKSD